MRSVGSWVFPLGEVRVYWWMFRCGNIVLLKTRFFGMANFTKLTSLPLLSCCRLSFLILSLKISSPLNFALTSRKIILIEYWGKWSKTYSTFSLKLSFISSLCSSLGACTFKKSYYTSDLSNPNIWHAITNKPHSLTCCTKHRAPNW